MGGGDGVADDKNTTYYAVQSCKLHNFFSLFLVSFPLLLTQQQMITVTSTLTASITITTLTLTPTIMGRVDATLDYSISKPDNITIACSSSSPLTVSAVTSLSGELPYLLPAVAENW